MSPKSIDPSVSMVNPAVDSSEAARKSQDRSSMLLVEQEEKYADEVYKETFSSYGGTFGITNHKHEHNITPANTQQQLATVELSTDEFCHEGADQDMNPDMEDGFEGFSFCSASDDLEMFDFKYMDGSTYPQFGDASQSEGANYLQRANQPASHSTAMQNRVVEMLDDAELFDEFVSSRNGGGRLSGYQTSWLSQHLARLRSSQGHGDEYMYLLEITLALQEQLKVTWDREDHEMQAMKESWTAPRVDREKAVREMLTIVVGAQFEPGDFEGANGELDFQRLRHTAEHTLYRAKNYKSASRRNDFFAMRKAVIAGLKEDKVAAPWFPSEEAINRLIDECCGMGLENAEKFLKGNGLLDAVEEILQQFKDHTAA